MKLSFGVLAALAGVNGEKTQDLDGTKLKVFR